MKAFLLGSEPLRRKVFRYLDRRFDLLPYPERLELGWCDRPNYGWPMFRQALVAKALGLKSYTAIEFGVAGGNGLVALEKHAEAIYESTGIAIHIVGFDTGEGLPLVQDARDHPYLWEHGEFKMDEPRLRAHLRTSQLVIGRVEDTLSEFVEDIQSPVGFIAFDLDLYTATLSAFKIFEIEHAKLMPRVMCYFDDILGPPENAYTAFAGELLAINEFNQVHTDMKIDRGVGVLRAEWAHWQDQIYTAHLFSHPLYANRVNQSADLSLAVVK